RMDRVGRALDRRTRHYILALQAAATREAPLVAPGARPRRLARSALPRLARAAPVSSAVRPDGSLTIHIQCGSPDESRAPNWLPAPPAQFHLILRLFGPEDAFFDGSYTLPPVVRVAPSRRRAAPGHELRARDGVARAAARVAAVLLALLVAVSLRAAETAATSGGDTESNTDLAKKTQNPVADLISGPFQNNFNFNTGPEKRSVWILNIQPVIPIKLTDDWNLITRTIVPIINQPPLPPAIDHPTAMEDIGDRQMLESPTT